jgi:uncharacterized phage protein (TIGR01671 family)
MIGDEMISRPIKFRAWHKAERRIYPVSCLYFEGKMTVTLIGHLYNWKEYSIGEEVELMQFTGLTDKHGKEIFEGDICRMQDGYPPRSSYEVYWNDDRWGLRDKDGGDYDNGDYYHGDDINWQEAEIIGNVFENQDRRL